MLHLSYDTDAKQHLLLFNETKILHRKICPAKSKPNLTLGKYPQHNGTHIFYSVNEV